MAGRHGGDPMCPQCFGWLGTRGAPCWGWIWPAFQQQASGSVVLSSNTGMFVPMDGCQEDLESPQLGGTVSRGFLLSVTFRRAIKQSKMTFLRQDDRPTSCSLSKKWQCGLDSPIRRPLPPATYPLGDRCGESGCSYSALGLTFSWYSQTCWASTVVVSILKTEGPS